MQTRHALALAAALIVAITVSHPVTAHANHVEVDPQVSSDGRLMAETVFIASDGFLVLHRDDGGDPGEPVGHVPVSRSDGFRTDVTLSVNEDVWTDWTTGTLWVVLHNDDGDGVFDPSTDRAVPMFGQAAEAQIVIEKGDRALVTAVSDRPQRTDDSTVTIRRAVMPRDGQLIVRNVSDGQVLGRTTLSAGNHEQVDVELNESSTEEHSGLTLEAVIAGPDGVPITSGDQSVSTRFGVQFRNGETATSGIVQTATATSDEGIEGPISQDGFGVLLVIFGIGVVLCGGVVGILSRRRKS